MSDAHELVLADKVINYSIRIGPLVFDKIKSHLNDLSGCCVVEHRDATRIHYHVFYVFKIPLAPSRNALDIWKSKFRELYEIPADWAFSNANQKLEDFYKYTLYEKYKGLIKDDIGKYKRPGSKLIINNTGQAAPEPPERPVTVDLRSASQKKPTTAEKQQKFYRFVKGYYDENKDEVIDYNGIAQLLADYWQTGGSEVTAPQYINFAMYNYLKDSGDKSKFQDHKQDWVSRVLSRIKK